MHALSGLGGRSRCRGGEMTSVSARGAMVAFSSLACNRLDALGHQDVGRLDRGCGGGQRDVRRSLGYRGLDDSSGGSPHRPVSYRKWRTSRRASWLPRTRTPSTHNFADPGPCSPQRPAARMPRFTAPAETFWPSARPAARSGPSRPRAPRDGIPFIQVKRSQARLARLLSMEPTESACSNSRSQEGSLTSPNTSNKPWNASGTQPPRRSSSSRRTSTTSPSSRCRTRARGRRAPVDLRGRCLPPHQTDRTRLRR